MDARQSPSASDGRRRRRIVHTTDDLLAEFQDLIPARQRSRDTESARTVAAPANHRILTKLISGRLWKHAVLMLATLAAAAFVVWIEFRQTEMPTPAGTTRRPQFITGLAGTYLLLAGQMSLLIGWIRSESTLDFNGRYRWWKWLSTVLIGIGGLWMTNVQHTLPLIAQVIVEPLLGSVSAARRTLVVVPAAALGLLVLSRVIPDMSRNRGAQLLFVGAILLACMRTTLTWGTSAGPLPLPLLDGILLGSATLLMCSLMLHARYVLYISNDPPTAIRRMPTPTNVNDNAAAGHSAPADASDTEVADDDDEAMAPDCVPLKPRSKSKTSREKSSGGKSTATPNHGKRKPRKAA